MIIIVISVPGVKKRANSLIDSWDLRVQQTRYFGKL
jgi:hypothetical protein